METRSRLRLDRHVSLLAVLAVFVIILTGATSAVSASKLSSVNVGITDGQTLTGSLSWTATVDGRPWAAGAG